MLLSDFFLWFFLSLRSLLIVHSYNLRRVRKWTDNSSKCLFRKLFNLNIVKSFFFAWKVGNNYRIGLSEYMISDLTLLCCIGAGLVLKRSSDSISSKWSTLTVTCSSDVIVLVSSIRRSWALKDFEVIKRLDLNIFYAIICVWMVSNDWLEPCWLDT